MQVYSKSNLIQKDILRLKNDHSIGFVPTMGALHKGHISLIKKAKETNDIVVVSIFVNPTQFDKKEDLIHYPRTLKGDLKLLEESGCDMVFTPEVSELYTDKIEAEHFNFKGLENQMEGKFREGHFDGVGTIVRKFFQIIQPHHAYFGEKDFQQLQIIRSMVKSLNLPIKIIPCEIYRESDGLAMSSRNSRLTYDQRKAAPFIYKVLKEVQANFQTKSISFLQNFVEERFKQHPILHLEYFTIADEKTLKTAIRKGSTKKYRAFIAVYAGTIRLIDNISLN
ncbi:pantoate--beta-alanine ligase [Flavobacteriaceae bacterium F08102]|nr:pantoate--beta-alanine ligase [Flavobacteriaceae bacterium F08102]